MKVVRGGGGGEAVGAQHTASSVHVEIENDLHFFTAVAVNREDFSITDWE